MDNVRDSRKPITAWVDIGLIKSGLLDPYEMAVYVQLVAFAGFTTQQCYPSTKTIAKQSNVSRRKVVSCLKSLEEKGLVHIQRRKDDSSVYTLLDTPPMHDMHTPMHDMHNPHAQGAHPPMHDMHPNYPQDNYPQEVSPPKDSMSGKPDAPTDPSLDKPSGTVNDDNNQPDKLSADDFTAYLDAVEQATGVKGNRRYNYLHMLRGTVKVKVDKRTGKPLPDDKQTEYYRWQPAHPVSLDELRGYAVWYKRKHGDISPVSSPEKLNDYIERFRSSHKRALTTDEAFPDFSHIQTGGYTPDEHRTSAHHVSSDIPW